MLRKKRDLFLQAVEKLGESLAATSPGCEREWCDRVGQALAWVKKAIWEHATDTADADGLLAHVQGLSQEQMPTVDRQVGLLHQERLDILKQVSTLQAKVQNALHAFQLPAGPGNGADTYRAAVGVATVPDFGALRRGGEELLTVLRQHKETETKLVLDAANIDIGVGD